MKLFPTVLAAAALMASAAHAIPVSIGLQESGVNGGAITTEVNQSNAGSTSFVGSYGTFSLSLNSSVEFPNLNYPDLNSNTQDSVTSGGAGTLTVYVSEQNAFIPPGGSGILNFLSGFTTNALTSGWTVTEATYLNSSNSQFGTGELLSTTTFLGSPATQSTNGFDSLYLAQGEYSFTEVYTITANGTGSSNSTIDLETQVPEPGTLALLGAGLTGLWFLRRRSFSLRA